MSRSVSLPSAGLALLGLSTLACALPLFETLGEGATFFVAHRADAIDIWAFAFRVYAVPPLLLTLLAAFLRILKPSLAQAAYAILAGVLAGLWALGMLRQLPILVAVGSAGFFSLGFMFFYYRSEKLQSFLQMLGWISPLALISFLAFSPASKLLNTASGVEPGKVAGSDTPVVMLVLDELSQAAISTAAGNIDEGRLPNFARLAAMSTWYSNTITVSTQTERAIASILSGRHTEEETPPVYSEFPHNIFTLVASSHTVYARETVSRLCPESVCKAEKQETIQAFDRAAMYADIRVIWWHSVLPGSFAEQWLPPINSRWKGFSDRSNDSTAGESAKSNQHWFAAMITDLTANNKNRFKNFLHRLNTSDQTSLHYLHLALPHAPWFYLPDGRVYNGRFTPGQSAQAYDWQENQFLIDQGALRYSLQVEYVDHLLGELLDAIEAHPRSEEILLIVVSDHGVAFAPNELRRRPVASTLADVARVPLFIRYPGAAGSSRDERPVETIDILPTIADVLGLPLTSPVDGQSLVSDNWQVRPRFIWEARDTIPDIEAHLDMATAIARIHRAVTEGQSAMDALQAQVSLGCDDPDIDMHTPVNATLKLERGEWYQQVRPRSPFVPARLTGWLQDLPAGTDIAVMLNGTLAGEGQVYGDTREVSIMLDARLFRAGANVISACVRTAQGMVPIDVDTGVPKWILQRDFDGEITGIQRGGKTWPNLAAATGNLAFSPQSSALGSIGGWVFEARDRTAALHLLLLDGDQAISTGFRQFPNPMHAKQQGFDQELPYWFSLEIDPAIKARGKRLTVLALFNNGKFIHLRMD